MTMAVDTEVANLAPPRLPDVQWHPNPPTPQALPSDPSTPPAIPGITWKDPSDTAPDTPEFNPAHVGAITQQLHAELGGSDVFKSMAPAQQQQIFESEFKRRSGYRNTSQLPESDAIKEATQTDFTKGRIASGISSALGAFSGAVANMARPIVGGLENGSGTATPINPLHTKSNMAGRVVGGTAPVIGASIVNPAAGASAMMAEGVGSARLEGAEMGYTPGQTKALEVERGIVGAIMGLIPGGKASKSVLAGGAKQALVQGAKTVGVMQGLNVTQAVLESGVKQAAGIQDEGTWQAVVRAAQSGEGWAQAILFGAAHAWNVSRQQRAYSANVKATPPEIPGVTWNAPSEQKPVGAAGSEVKPAGPGGAETGTPSAPPPPLVRPTQENPNAVQVQGPAPEVLRGPETAEVRPGVRGGNPEEVARAGQTEAQNPPPQDAAVPVGRNQTPAEIQRQGLANLQQAIEAESPHLEPPPKYPPAAVGVGREGQDAALQQMQANLNTDKMRGEYIKWLYEGNPPPETAISAPPAAKTTGKPTTPPPPPQEPPPPSPAALPPKTPTPAAPVAPLPGEHTAESLRQLRESENGAQRIASLAFHMGIKPRNVEANIKAILAKQEANRAQAKGAVPSETVPTVPEDAGGKADAPALIATPEPTGPVKEVNKPKAPSATRKPPTPSEMLLEHGVSDGVFPNDYEMTSDSRAAVHGDVTEGMTAAQRRQMGEHISEDLAGNATAGMTAAQQARYEAGVVARYSATKAQRIAEAIEHYKNSPDPNLRKLAAYADAEGTGRKVTKPVESFNHGDEFDLGTRHFRVEVDADGNTHFIDTDMEIPYAEGDFKYNAGSLKKAPTMGKEGFAPPEDTAPTKVHKRTPATTMVEQNRAADKAESDRSYVVAIAKEGDRLVYRGASSIVSGEPRKESGLGGLKIGDEVTVVSTGERSNGYPAKLMRDKRGNEFMVGSHQNSEFDPALSEVKNVAAPAPTTGQGSLLGERYEGSNIGSKTGSMFGDTSKGPASGLEAEQARQAAEARANVDKDQGTLPLGEMSMGDMAISREVQANRAKYPRIKVDPITSPTAEAPANLILNIADITGRNVRRGKTARGQGGVYKPASTDTVIRRPNDIDTAAHEIAHSLDDLYHVTSPAFDAELGKFWWHGSATSTGPRSELPYKRAEGVAEWVRAYMLNPEAATAAAPGFARHFEDRVPADVKTKIRAAGDDVRRWAGAPATEKTKANIQWEQPKPAGVVDSLRQAVKGTGADFEITAMDRFQQAFTDRLRPLMKAITTAKMFHGIEKLMPEKDPELLARNYAGINDKIEDMLDHGMTDARLHRTTKGFKDILDGLDTTSDATLQKDTRDMLALAVSERTIERGDVLDKRSYRALVESIRDGIATLGDSPANAERVQQLRLAIQTAEAVPGPYAERLQAIADALPGTRYAGRAAYDIKINKARKAQLSGAGALIEPDDVIAQKTIAELQADPERYARLSTAVQKYRQWGDAVLQYMREKGRISQEQYDAIKEDNQFYVAFNRVLEKAGVAKRTNKHLGTVRNPIQQFKGSTETMENPLVSLLESTYSAIREADRNEVMRSFIDVLTNSRGMYEGEPKAFAEIGRLAKEGDPNTIKVFRKGKVEHWQFDKPLFESLKGMGEDDFSLAVRLGSVLPNLMKSAVIHSPQFIVRNAIRDTVSRSILSEHGGKPWDIAQGMTKAELSELNRAGGGQAGMYLTDRQSYHREITRRMRELTAEGSSIIALPKRIAHAYDRLAKDSELIGRVAEYRRAKEYARTKLGYDEYNAMLYAGNKARSLLDFAQAGSVMRVINRFVPFSNAGVQSIRKAVQVGRSDPKGMLLRMAAFTVPLSLAALAWNNQDEATKKEYFQLPAYQRDMFWNFKIGQTWLRVPKPFELGLLSSATERILAKNAGDDRAFEGYAGSVAKSIIPFDEASAAGPFQYALQAMANRDFFRDRYIVPPEEADLELARRPGTDNASRAGQIIQRLTGLDARKGDFLLESQFGGLGQMATRISDVGREGRGVGTTAAQLSGMASAEPTYSARDVQEAMKLAKDQGESQHPLMSALREKLALARQSGTQEDEQEARRYGTLARKVLAGEMTGEQVAQQIADPKLAEKVAGYELKTDAEYRLSKSWGESLLKEFSSLSPEEKQKYGPMVAGKIIRSDMTEAQQDAAFAQYGIPAPPDLAITREHKDLNAKASADEKRTQQIDSLMRQVKALEAERNWKDAAAKRIEAQRLRDVPPALTSKEKARLAKLRGYASTKNDVEKRMAEGSMTQPQGQAALRAAVRKITG